LNITDQYEILLVLALGKPIEKVILEDLDPSGNTRYYRDELGGHHVPKRKLEDLVISEDLVILMIFNGKSLCIIRLHDLGKVIGSRIISRYRIST